MLLPLFYLIQFYLIQKGTALLPVVNWTYVPIYWHACNESGPLSDAAIAFLTTSGFASLTFEKGSDVFGPDNATTYAEDRILAAARQVKAVVPSLPVIAYFNSVLNWPYYRLARDMAAHPGWALATSSGAPLRVRGDPSFPQPKDGMTVFDFSQKPVRDWFSAACAKMDPALIDGCFQDRAGENGFPGVNASMLAAYAAGHDAVLAEMQAALGGARMVMQNNYYKFVGAKAAMVEEFTSSEGAIENLMQLAAQKFIVHVHVYDSTCKNITSQLAAFLIAATDTTFFACSPGWQVNPQWPAAHDIWMTIWPEYRRPLGAPRGPAEKQGALWARTFGAGTVVTFNVTSAQGAIAWSS